MPVQVANLAGVDSVAAGFGYTCAHQTGAGIVCWGTDLAGELGEGVTQEQRLTPAAVVGF